MENQPFQARVALLATALIIAIMIYGSVQAFEEKSKQANEDSSRKESDLIYIDVMKVFGSLERPGVTFKHDLHVNAVKKDKKDCSVCHINEKERLSFKFKRLKDSSRNEVMNIYHDNCLACHREMEGKQSKTGPTACGECHLITSPYSSSASPILFDKSLHYIHSKSQDDKCGVCHHEYDIKTKKLVHNEGEESSCRYCHEKEGKENKLSLKSASHTACIGCHLDNLKGKKDTGPVKCDGCHDKDKQNTKEKLAVVPRIERKQPDFTIIRTNGRGQSAKDKNEQKTAMNPVPFNHKAHEEYNDSCRVCHHKDFSACSDCHDLKGKNEGALITLADAMHQPESAQSCIGCHNLKKKDLNCAGCHVPMAESSDNLSACVKCHIEPGKNIIKGDKQPDYATKGEKGHNPRLAETMLNTRIPVKGLPEDDKIPEKIIIKGLSKKYEPVDFPHRKIVKILSEKIKDSRLASYFHDGKDTLCQGCHHNTPAEMQKPGCGTCHPAQAKDDGSQKPGLMGAYHLQCMGCHKEMGMEKPSSCTDCHAEKKVSQNK